MNNIITRRPAKIIIIYLFTTLEFVLITMIFTTAKKNVNQTDNLALTRFHETKIDPIGNIMVAL